LTNMGADREKAQLIMETQHEPADVERFVVRPTPCGQRSKVLKKKADQRNRRDESGRGEKGLPERRGGGFRSKTGEKVRRP